MVALLIIGVILIAAGVAGFFFAQRARRHLHAMIGAETLPVAEITERHRTALEIAGSGGFGEVLEVVGAAAPGPEGPLVAEFSKQSCVWHRHEIKRRYKDTRRESNGRTRTTQRTETVASLESSQPFGVTDQSGTIVVQADGANVDRPEKVVSRFERARPDRAQIEVFGIQLSGWNRDDTIGYEYTEWILRPGARLYVHGLVSDHTGQLAFGKPDDGPFVVSTRTEQDLRKSTGLRQKLFAFGGLAAIVVGVVLVVIGLLV